jgi:hypothetical protein
MLEGLCFAAFSALFFFTWSRYACFHLCFSSVFLRYFCCFLALSLLFDMALDGQCWSSPYSRAVEEILTFEIYEGFEKQIACQTDSN